MEIRQLRYFLVLAEHGRFRPAAQRLHVTTQALSMAMTALERAVGCELLVRGRGCRVVELTAAGHALRAHARQIVERADRALAGLREPAGRAPFVVGLVAGGVAELNAPILRRFRRRYPDGSLQVCTIDDRTSERGADVVLGPARSVPGHRVHLFSDRAVVALPRRHRLAGATDLDVRDLRGEVRVPLGPTDPDRPASPDAALTEIGAGLGIGILAACTARHHPRPDVVHRPLTGVPAIAFAVSARVPVDRDPLGPAATFVRIARTTARERIPVYDVPAAG